MLPYENNVVTLSSSNPLLTLDYATEALGFPTLEVKSVSELAQIELKYTEEFAGLNNEYGDGPWTFTNGLSNTFRTETFEITGPGSIQSFFLQGGLRWQSIHLLTNGSISFSSIGLQTDAPIIPSNRLPGSFNSSNSLYNEIWGLGGKAVQAACVDGGTLKPTWEITGDGAFIRGQQSAQSIKGTADSNYTMSFSTKIVRGGTGWRVAMPITPYGPYFILTSDYPVQTTFVNTDRVLLPPSTLVVGYGWSIVNQSTLATGYVEHYPLSMAINENEWYEISTSITPQGFQISVNDVHVATVSYAESQEFPLPGFASPSVTSGTWAFGPFQDQIAYVKDVTVVGSNGTLLYQNPMTSEDVLIEYGVSTNEASVCLDGSKRDRLVWIGDFVHTARTLGSSTHRMDYITGVIGHEFAWQQTTGLGIGFVPTDAQMGASSQNKDAYYPAEYGITDYQIFYLVTVGDYYQMTGDLTTASKYWQQTKLLVQSVLALVNPVTGLMAGEGTFYFIGPANGTAVSSLMVIALRQLVPIAEALHDANAASSYTAAADSLSSTINQKLWNEELGTYSLSLTSPGNFSAAAIAFTIRGGVANATQAALSISKLPELKYGVGYVTDTTVNRTNVTQLSPNVLGFLLESLFIANSTFGLQDLDVAKDLLDNFWSKMVTQNEYYTGATWEYLYPDASPGIGLFTSLSHPWGSAPTYVLPEYALGIKAIDPGYQKWQFKPLLYGLGLSNAEGTVPTPFGPIEASWTFTDGRVVLVIEAPRGTTGIVSLPFKPSQCTVSGENASGQGSSVPVNGGERVEIIAML